MNLRIVATQNLGVVDQNKADSLMKDLQKMRIDDKIDDTILICEHPEIVTIGPRARNEVMQPPEG